LHEVHLDFIRLLDQFPPAFRRPIHCRLPRD
jgi:hypothetical protein